jgi:hypothetical protein
MGGLSLQEALRSIRAGTRLKNACGAGPGVVV